LQRIDVARRGFERLDQRSPKPRARYDGRIHSRLDVASHCEQLGLIGSERLCGGRTLQQGERRLVSSTSDIR
jgi:hypothetical protein